MQLSVIVSGGLTTFKQQNMAAHSRQLSVDFKSRVITCLNRLADRDTLPAASNELDVIARGLSNDGFAPFLTCLSATDSSHKPAVRRHSVRLIAVLCSAHGDALSPHVSRMLNAVLRRIRDPDTAVRSACVEAVSSIAAQITSPPFSSAILKPIADSIFREQDRNAQIGAALCLAAAIEAAPDPDRAEVGKLLPKIYRLARNDCFKAKPPLLSLMGSIVSVGGASNRNVLRGLVSTLIEFLSSEDWAARKAASETLGRLAVAERDLVAEFRSSCITSLDTRRFDKVKVVREAMNRALDWWKEVASTNLDARDPQVKLSPKVCGSGASSPTPSKSTSDTTSGLQTPKHKRSFARSKSLALSNCNSYPVKYAAVKSNARKSYGPSIGRSFDESNIKVHERRPLSNAACQETESDILLSNMACHDNESDSLSIKMACQDTETDISSIKMACHDTKTDILSQNLACQDNEANISLLNMACQDNEIDILSQKLACQGSESDISLLKKACHDNESESSLLKMECQDTESDVRSLKMTCQDSESENLSLKMACQDNERKSCMSSGGHPDVLNDRQIKIDDLRTRDCTDWMDDSTSESEEECDGLFLIHRQLQAIGSQQSNLLQFLERFIGNSQKGMSSLEKRVNGLEKTLEEMQRQHCFGAPPVIMSPPATTGNTCW
ncbi:unnamed protein product [Cuscuta campestris]|uniref:TORTIFOLIA1/SINE1-2 N-terminal domain-containing protein n=1 Tax=Cuscuta campestris TaxID=132261 RepID=A0A484KQ24_9ASTE|nr:unnamed protein product [Cuscuta campestris]